MSPVNDKRMLVVGLDGATFDIIRPLADRGELPCIGEMVAKGWAATLQSTVPPITPPAWSSFATGALPDDHGVFGFNYPDPGDYALRLASAADLLRPTLWRRLSRHGRRVVLLDLPFTFPAEEIDGCIVAGFPLAPTGQFTHPPDLAGRLESAGVACRRHPSEMPDASTAAFLPWLDGFLDERARMFRHLSTTEPWQFAAVGTMVLDWAQHALWKYLDSRFVFAGEPEAAERRETLLACYRRIDRFVANLREVAGEKTVCVLVSDHGFATSFHYDWVNEALAQAGLLHWCGGTRGIGRRIGGAALKAARSSARLQRLGKRMLGDTASARQWARSGRAYDDIDWDRTRLFPAGDYHLNLYVNDRSRFARGIVEGNADREKVLADAIAALETFRPPHHDLPLVRRVVRNEVPGDETAARTPDLSLELTVLPPEFNEAATAPMAGICGFHSPEGIFITNTIEWLGAEPLENMAIQDVAPAILHYFGIEKSGAEDRGERRAPLRGFSDEETPAVLDQLRELGYLD